MSITSPQEDAWQRKTTLSRLSTARKTLADHWPDTGDYDYLEDAFRIVDVYLAKLEARLQEETANAILTKYKKELE